MLFQTPKFWYNGSQWISNLLWPFSLLYRAACKIVKLLNHPQRISIPIICCGNAVLGGAGKTTTVLSLVNMLQQHHYHPHIVMRGYRGSIKTAHQVNLNYDTCETVGDEALMVAAYAPTWIARNRYEGVLASQKAGAQLIILDDGLQNYDVDPLIKILVVNAMQCFGNNKIFPSGPLREKVENIVKRCQGVILIDHDPTEKINTHLSNIKLWHAVTKPQPQVVEHLKSKKIYAFSGLGFNEKFFKMLINETLNVVKAVPYPDHYHYLHQDLSNMFREAQAIGATLVTTTKDWQRLDDRWKAQIIHIPVTLELHNPDDIMFMINQFLKKNV